MFMFRFYNYTVTFTDFCCASDKYASKWVPSSNDGTYNSSFKRIIKSYNNDFKRRVLVWYVQGSVTTNYSFVTIDF